MDAWRPIRSSIYSHEFQASLATLPIGQRQWDYLATDIENVLCGVPREALDQAYPEIASTRMRVLITATARGVPSS